MPARTASRQQRNAFLSSSAGNLKIENKMEVVKKLRIRIDALIQAAKIAICSAETTLAYRELQLAKAWLGKSLGYLGNATPYPAVDSIAQIPATTEVSEAPFQLPGDPHQNANALRDEIESVIGAVGANEPFELRQKLCFNKCWEHLTEAKFWYGYEIGRIRNANIPASSIDEAKMDAITNTDAPEPPTESEQAEDDKAFENPQPFVVEKVVSNEKISENDNENRQEKQPKTPRKKG